MRLPLPWDEPIANNPPVQPFGNGPFGKVDVGDGMVLLPTEVAFMPEGEVGVELIACDKLQYCVAKGLESLVVETFLSGGRGNSGNEKWECDAGNPGSFQETQTEAMHG